MSETTYLDKVEEQYRDYLDLDGPVPNPDPELFSITPSSFEAEPEDETLPITVAGSGFTGSTSVTLGGVEATEMTVNSAAEIEAVFPIPEEAGSLNVVVHKGDLDSNAVALTFTIAE